MTESSDLTPCGILSSKQAYISMVTGIVLWYCAAWLIWLLEPSEALRGNGAFVTYVAAIPTGPLTVWLLRWLGRLRSDQLVSSACVGLAAATYCDGVALLWFPELYGNDPSHVLAGAALILWGAAQLLASAYWQAQKELTCKRSTGN